MMRKLCESFLKSSDLIRLPAVGEGRSLKGLLLGATGTASGGAGCWCGGGGAGVTRGGGGGTTGLGGEGNGRGRGGNTTVGRTPMLPLNCPNVRPRPRGINSPEASVVMWSLIAIRSSI